MGEALYLCVWEIKKTVNATSLTVLSVYHVYFVSRTIGEGRAGFSSGGEGGFPPL